MIDVFPCRCVFASIFRIGHTIVVVIELRLGATVGVHGFICGCFGTEVVFVWYPITIVIIDGLRFGAPVFVHRLLSGCVGTEIISVGDTVVVIVELGI